MKLLQGIFMAPTILENKTGAPSDPLADFWAKTIFKTMVK